MSFNLAAAIETQQQLIIILQMKAAKGELETLAPLAAAIEGWKNLKAIEGRQTAEASAPNSPNYLVR